MSRDVKVHDPTAAVVDDEKAVEDAECNGRNGEKLHRRNGFPMVAKECRPTFGRLRNSRSPAHPAGDGSLGDIETQHEEFTVNARGAPGWVLRHHLDDQIAHRLRNSLA